jgi:PHD/YefM family antitoxin component YafN of YafNO toxin-antitoxin module
VKTTYSITEAQAKFPAVVREAQENPVVITRRDKVVGYLLSPERMEGILETLEILANPAAMKELRRARQGRGRYRPVTDLDEG